MKKGWHIAFNLLIVVALIAGFTKAKNGKAFSFKKVA